MHQSFVSTAPHLRGWAGKMIFTFQSPGTSPALWGQADVNNPALCPTLHNRKSQQGKCPNIITPHSPGTAGTIKKYLSSTLPLLFHGYPRRWGPWIQMTGVLSSLNIVQINKANKTKWSCFFLTQRYLELTNNRNILNASNFSLLK